MFESEPAQRTMQQCLRARASPRPVRLTPGAHTRNVTSPVLTQTVQSFVAACSQRTALVAWLRAVTRTGGAGSAEYPLPAELMMGGQLNPTVAALVVAVGQQLDMVDAAVQDLQVCPVACPDRDVWGSVCVKDDADAAEHARSKSRSIGTALGRDARDAREA